MPKLLRYHPSASSESAIFGVYRFNYTKDQFKACYDILDNNQFDMIKSFHVV